MPTLVELAPAKVNLTLAVLGRRADGYHLLQTLFQFVDLVDHLHFQQRGDGQINLLTPVAGVATQDNLIVRAARKLQSVSGAPIGVDIRVDKCIPTGAGLGGGSSNAATTLIALNRLWNLGFPTDELADIGLALGADVPVFVRGHAAWAEGIGERLSPVDLPEPWYLLLLPPVSVLTADIFAAPDLRRDHPWVRFEDYQDGLCGNDCETVTCERHPEVAEALAWARRFGPARMSGTGACVFLETADRASAETLVAQAPPAWRPCAVRGLNRSPLAAIMRGL